jgi:flagellar hook-associated protein 2
LTGGTGVSFTDTNGNGVSGDTAADNAVQATDARVLVNNVEVVSSSNTLQGVIPGVTLNVFRKDPATTVGVDVTADDGALRSEVLDFVNAYNDLVKFANDQAASAATGDTSSIGRDSLLRSLRNTLRSAIGASYSGAGTFDRLSELGIEFTQTGTLQLNDTLFSAAIQSNAAGVKQILSSSTGAFTSVTSAIGDYSESGGLIAIAKDTLTRESSALDAQIAAMQDRLAVQKAALQQEFTAADDAMSALNSQSSALTNFQNSLASGAL